MEIVSLYGNKRKKSTIPISLKHFTISSITLLPCLCLDTFLNFTTTSEKTRKQMSEVTVSMRHFAMYQAKIGHRA